MQVLQGGPLWTDKAPAEDVVSIAADTNHLFSLCGDFEAAGCFAQ